MMVWHEDECMPGWLYCNTEKQGTDDEVVYLLWLDHEGDDYWHVYGGNGETEYRPAHATLAEAKAWCEEHPTPPVVQD